MSSSVDWERFVDALRQALNHLYDSVHLRKSPLVALLGLGSSPDTAAALREVLSSAVAALEPPRGTPLCSENHEYYRVLNRRYIQGFIQRDVAAQMGVSLRQVRRIQTAALESLAGHLWDRYNPDLGALAGQAPPDPLAEGEDAEPEEGSDAAHPPDGLQPMEREFSWLNTRFPDRCVDLEDAVREALQVVQDLVQGRGVAIELKPPAAPLTAAVPRMVLKQLVLNLITASIHGLRGGGLSLDLGREPERVLIRLTARGGEADATFDGDTLGVSRQLAEVFGGVIEARQDGADGIYIRASFPEGGANLVLAVEDNGDTLQLWRRYVEDSPFSLRAVQAPSRALEVALETRPALIVLDVMMPGIDGWRLLTEFRNHPQTAAIPVVVCTVLPQEELALSYGASAFIRKPATRQAFLAVLRQQIAAAGRT